MYVCTLFVERSNALVRIDLLEPQGLIRQTPLLEVSTTHPNGAVADYEQHRKPSDFHEWANAKLEALLDPRIGGALHLRQPSDLLALADAYASPINMITGQLRKQDMRSALACVAILIARKHAAPPNFPTIVDLAPLPSDWREYLPYIPEELAAVFDVS